MNADEFKRYREHAITLHGSQEGEHQVGLDAIFAAVVAHALAARCKPGRKPVEATEAPPWFADAVKRLAGRSVTASQFLVLSGRTPVTDNDRRNVGRWLRDAGYRPKKIAGQLLFQL